MPMVLALNLKLLKRGLALGEPRGKSRPCWGYIRRAEPRYSIRITTLNRWISWADYQHGMVGSGSKVYLKVHWT